MASHSGQTIDAQGVPVPGVQVRLYDSDNNKIKSTTSGDNGVFTFTNIDFGNYEVRLFGENYTEDH